MFFFLELQCRDNKFLIIPETQFWYQAVTQSSLNIGYYILKNITL